MTTRSKVWLSAGAIVLLLLACVGFVFPIDLLIAVLVGWAFYLYRVVPEVRVDWSGLGMGLVTLALFAAGLHAALGRWYAHDPTTGDAPGTGWRARWTATILAAVVVLFAAGISVVGAMHQLGWLFTSADPWVDSNWEAATGTQSRNNLHQFDLAMHNYHDTYSVLPAGGTFNAAGHALHGWQTALLPYLDQVPLYEQIDLDRPWNNPVNAELFRRPIGVFTNPEFRRRFGNNPRFTADDVGFSLSHYAVNERMFGPNTSVALEGIRDGTANTIMAGEVNANFRPWGHPVNWRDPARGINTSPDSFGSPFAGGMHFLLCDGHSRFVSEDIDSAVLKALATPDGGEHIGEF